MGCSTSCPTNFITPHQNNDHTSSASSSSSPSNSQLNSPYYTFSETTTCPSATPVSKTLSLVHHPPVRKGDTSHFVSLTSSTYGSLVLNEISSPDPEIEELMSPVVAQVKKIHDFGEDPLSPDSVINTWELMAGLDEVEFDETHRSSEIVESYEFIANSMSSSSSKSLWEHLSDEMLKMSSNLGSKEVEYLELNGANSMVPDSKGSCLAAGGDRIVLYYTSLRGIRKTYEDCCFVRVIFRGFRVCVDERDISMDRSYRMELQEALKGKVVTLPQVFIKGKHVGSMEEIKQLNESGELVKLLQGFPLMDSGFICEGCGDARFVPCPRCNGSRKVYEEEELDLIRCPDCNENGLIRCSNCCP